MVGIQTDLSMALKIDLADVKQPGILLRRILCEGPTLAVD